jgi:hypothetical protein
MAPNGMGILLRAAFKAALFIGVFVVPLVVGEHHVSGAEAIPLYVFAGQSNMVGDSTQSAQLPLVDPKLAAEPTNVRFWGPNQDFAGRWGPLQAPTEIMEPSSHSGFGPEIGAAPLLAAGHPGTQVAIVKLARGGTNLYADWNPRSDLGLYVRLVARVLEAKRQLETDTGKAVRIAGFFWMQGESDATLRGPASWYQKNLTEFIASVRQDLHAPRMPFVIGRIVDLRNVDFRFPYSGVVRDAQSRVAKTVPRTYLVSTDDLQRDSISPIHFDTRGTVDLGRRFVNRSFPL